MVHRFPFWIPLLALASQCRQRTNLASAGADAHRGHYSFAELPWKWTSEENDLRARGARSRERDLAAGQGLELIGDRGLLTRAQT